MKKILALFAVITLSLPAPFANALEPVDIYREHSPAVVLVYGILGGGMAQKGSGFIISKDGLILTNAHVILNKNQKPITKLYAFLKPNRVTGDIRNDLKKRYHARVVRYNSDLDIALLKIDAPQLSNIIKMSDSDIVDIGEKVVAIGHPEQGGLWTLTTGTIGSRKKNVSVQGKDMFQTEASINHGNSGGPLIDSNGNVIGMNTSIARVSSTGSAITGVNFALQSNVLLKWLHDSKYKVTAAKATRPKATVASSSSIDKPKPIKKPKEGLILTPRKPFRWADVKSTIAEMENQMDNMRGTLLEKLKSKKNKRRHY